MKSVVILGSTGSIGTSALDVVAAHPDRLRVAGLAARTNATRLIEQARRFGVPRVAVGDPAEAARARRSAPAGIEVLSGPEGLRELAGGGQADLVLCALVGIAGLQPVLDAIEAGRDVALATKEVLVAAGQAVMQARARRGVRLLPVDSEHSALLQCLQAGGALPACVRPAAGPAADAGGRVRRLILTASGGPFALRPDVDFDRVTRDEALNHPRWAMGRKVTIDSASMMNKGLELIEAHWMFDLPVAQIGVLVHPESIVHSLVEFVDGSVLAQLAPPDMRLPIHVAFQWPERVAADLPRLDLARLARLHFTEPDETRFPCLRLARQAAEAGGTCPAVLNAANELAVDAFLSGHIAFSGIWRVVEQTLQAHRPARADSLESVIEADAWARQEASRAMGETSRRRGAA